MSDKVNYSIQHCTHALSVNCHTTFLSKEFSDTCTPIGSGSSLGLDMPTCRGVKLKYFLVHVAYSNSFAPYSQYIQVCLLSHSLILAVVMEQLEMLIGSAEYLLIYHHHHFSLDQLLLHLHLLVIFFQPCNADNYI